MGWGLTHVDAALIPAGKADTKSANLTPSGLSSRHSPVQFLLGMGGVFPTHRPMDHPVPVHSMLFSSTVQLARNARALACAACHRGEGLWEMGSIGAGTCGEV